MDLPPCIKHYSAMWVWTSIIPFLIRHLPAKRCKIKLRYDNGNPKWHHSFRSIAYELQEQNVWQFNVNKFKKRDSPGPSSCPLIHLFKTLYRYIRQWWTTNRIRILSLENFDNTSLFYHIDYDYLNLISGTKYKYYY